MLAKRFGVIPVGITEQIANVSLLQIEQWFDRLTTNGYLNPFTMIFNSVRPERSRRAQHPRDIIITNKLSTQNKRLRQTIRGGLYLIRQG